MKKILVVMSHPDDESFGPGATIAKYAAGGVEIHLLCATRGESGQWSDIKDNGRKLGDVREAEHRAATKILGIKSHEYMGYVDGYLSNVLMDTGELVGKIEKKIEEFQPDILLTFDLLGLSGHIDHIAMAMATTRAFDEMPSVKKLYYYANEKKKADLISKVSKHRSWGRREDEITTVIDGTKFQKVKFAAADCHKTQANDVKRLKIFWKLSGGKEKFVLGGSRVKTVLPETDLFSGIK